MGTTLRASLHLAALLIFLSCIALPLAALEDPIELNSGLISGAQLEDSIRVYKGIPYAAPPVGDLRWRPPQAVAPWAGIRDASAFGAVSPQSFGTSERWDEDSLFLNIWTPAEENSDKLPVMVWIHGGAWSGGSGSMPIFDGSKLARKGVVLVTINYRLGALGFLAHPALSSESDKNVSGNYGILDVIAALEWVQSNIQVFGGDSANVTLFGESAGATSIYLLLTSPLAEGLFHKAIVESAWLSPGNITYLQQPTGFSASAEDIGIEAVDKYFEESGYGSKASSRISESELLSRLRDLPAEEALKISVSTKAVVDGWMLNELPSHVFRNGRVHSVPLIVGINNGEGSFFTRNIPATALQQRREKASLFGKHADELLQFYGALDDSDIRRAETDFITDTWFSRPAREMARSITSAGNATYFYQFTRNRFSPAAPAPHVAEVPYVFNNLNPSSSKTEDLELADLISSYWVEFAKKGNPNNSNLPAWQAFNPDSETYQILDIEISSGESLHKDRLDALEKYVNQQLAGSGSDLSGEWILSITILGEYAGDASIELMQQADEVLEGVYTGQLLNGPFTGTYSNEEFEFSFDSDIGMSFTFIGKLLENGELEGTLESGGRTLGSFSGNRAE